jgi:hypothetical protein
MRRFLLALCLSGGGLSFAPAPSARNDADKDTKLVEAVKAAAAKGVAPTDVGAIVGTKSTLNTARDKDRATFSRVDLVEDPDNKPPLPDRETLRWVAYWVRPVEARNPKIVGIYWPKEGKPRMFYGEVLPR